jgi:hypothetical protein
MLLRYRVSGIVLASLVAGLSLLTVGLLTQQKVSAVTFYQGYFNGRNSTNGGFGTFVDCASGGCSNYKTFTCTNGCTASPDQNKATFINAALGSSAKAFYVNVMSGGQCGGKSANPSGAMITCWENLINNPAIGIKVVTTHTGTNSYYDTSINDFAFSQEATDFPSLIFYNTKTGAQYTIIKIICGNILNDVGLPNPPPVDTEPNGGLQLGCNPNGTAYAKLWFYDVDGNTSATLTVNFAGTTPPNATYSFGAGSPYNNNGGYVAYQIPVGSDAFAGNWGAALTIQDKGGSLTKVINSSGASCDVPPNGGLQLGCNPNGTAYAKLWYYDANGNTSAKLTVNFAGTTPPNATYSFGAGSPYNNNGGYVAYQIPAAAADFTGNWGAALVINDNGSTGTKTINAAGVDCDKPPTGSFVSVTCDAPTERYIISATWDDPNGPTQGEVAGAGGGVTASRSGSSNPTAVGVASATWYFKTTDLPGNQWPVQLKVRDSDGGILLGYQTIATAAKPNCIPKGTISDSGTSCTTVSLKLWDPNEPNSNINYYLSVNGAAEQGAFTFSGGEGAGAITRNVSGLAGFDYWKNNNIVLYGVDVDTGAQYNLGNATLPICGRVSCTGAMTTLPGTMVAQPTAVSFTVWVTVQNAPYGPPGAHFESVTVQPPSGPATTIVPSGAYPAPGVGYTGTAQLTDNASPALSVTPKQAGTYVLSWTFGGGESNPPAVTCTTTSEAAYEPYFTVLGGDVSAGQGFGPSCTDDKTDADIMGYNMDSGSVPRNYFGASSRQGAIATGRISQFATDNTNDPTANPTGLGGSTDGLTAAIDNSPPSGLAFANSNKSGTLYGGDILHNDAGLNWCVPDYEANAPTPSGPFNPGNITSGTFSVSGTIPNLHIPAGVNLTLVATSDVYIRNDITYDPYGGNPANIPQFNLLVKDGNIYVDHNVQELHGFYAAEKTGTNTGVLYTCATGSGSPSTNYNVCNKPLTFYGAVSAYELIPGRTFGNIAKALDTGSDQRGEQFVFTPELWLGSAAAPGSSCVINPTQTNCLYQAYTSLPPVL